MIFNVIYDSGDVWLFCQSEVFVLGYAKRLWQSGAVANVSVEDSKGTRLFYAGKAEECWDHK